MVATRMGDAVIDLARPRGVPARAVTPGRVAGRWGAGVQVPLLVDGSAWVAGLVTAVWARYGYALTTGELRRALAVGAFAGCVQAVVGYAQHLYRGQHACGTFEEVLGVAGAVLVTSVLVLAADVTLSPRPVPGSGPVIGAALSLIAMFGFRYGHRLRHERGLRPDRRRSAPALLFGAGEAGRHIARAILRDRDSRYVPVGLLDDDPAKRYLRVHGVPVLGGRHDIAAAVARTGATAVIFSVSRADADLIQEVRRATLAAGAAFKLVPTVGELLTGQARPTDIRDMTVADFLGRRPVELDLTTVAGYLRGRRVLVTGAGGSIGSELCRQISRLDPSELMMLDRDESALHAVQLSLRGRALLDDPELILADLRDADAVGGVFRARRPEVVFHAGALKHLTLLQRHPGEAVKTNIWGTLTLLDLARDVETFVNVSTDKAANPINVLGYSKRVTERLTAYAATVHDGLFLSVRFGNVLGSRGSVLAAFTAQAERGGPITVTHPDVTRYFMTVEEAVALVIRAGSIARGGEALVLDMGKPVRIADVARHLAQQAPGPVGIVYTGLRPGEKLREDLFARGERDERPRHPLISHVAVAPLHPDHVRALDPAADPGRLIAALARTCEADLDPGLDPGPDAGPLPGTAADAVSRGRLPTGRLPR
jgi:FlaA1/EpsC-like NDP-sugar epimerase